MKRSFSQIYVRNSIEAVALYQKAFDAPLGFYGRDDSGMYIHAELEVNGGVIAVGFDDSSDERVTGNTMQLCVQFGDGGDDKVRRAYDVLKNGGQINTPLGPCIFSPLAADVVDQFGVRWCLFV